MDEGLPWWVAVPLFLFGMAVFCWQTRAGWLAWLGLKEVADADS